MSTHSVSVCAVRQEQTGPLTKIVECIQHNIEALEPVNIVLRLLDIAVNGLDIDMRIKLQSGLSRDEGFRALDMLFLEQELTVEIRKIYRIEIDLRSAAEVSACIASLNVRTIVI